MNKNHDILTDNLLEMETKLQSIKRLVANSNRRPQQADEGGSGGGEASNARLVERVEGVSRRLETVQRALEASGGGAAPGNEGGSR